jgi:hypothetical protein
LKIQKFKLINLSIAMQTLLIVYRLWAQSVVVACLRQLERQHRRRELGEWKLALQVAQSRPSNLNLKFWRCLLLSLDLSQSRSIPAALIIPEPLICHSCRLRVHIRRMVIFG